jgi:uncharacterized protein YicC (UPF0701 family)
LASRFSSCIRKSSRLPQASMDLKLLIEQMREQIQNLE